MSRKCTRNDYIYIYTRELWKDADMYGLPTPSKWAWEPERDTGNSALRNGNRYGIDGSVTAKPF